MEVIGDGINGFKTTQEFDDRGAAGVRYRRLTHLRQIHRAVGLVLPPKNAPPPVREEFNRDDYGSEYEFDDSDFDFMHEDNVGASTGYVVEVTSKGPSLEKMAEIPAIQALFIQSGDEELFGTGRGGPKRFSDWFRAQLCEWVRCFELMEGEGCTPTIGTSKVGLSLPYDANSRSSHQHFVFTGFRDYVSRTNHWETLANLIASVIHRLRLPDVSTAEYETLITSIQEPVPNLQYIYSLPIFYSSEDRVAFIIRLYGYMMTNQSRMFWVPDMVPFVGDFDQKCRGYTKLATFMFDVKKKGREFVRVIVSPVRPLDPLDPGVQPPPYPAEEIEDNQTLFDNVSKMRHGYIHCSELMGFVDQPPLRDRTDLESLFDGAFPNHIQILWTAFPGI